MDPESVIRSATTWTSGKALGRYLLDNPHTVAGRAVLDVGSAHRLARISVPVHDDLPDGAQEAVTIHQIVLTR